jgi:hypothetical protein
MAIKNYQLFFILLLFAPLQCFDFIPDWSIYIYISLIFLRIFTSLPQIIILPVMLYASFSILKDFNFRLQPESAIGILNFMLLAKMLIKTENFKTYYILGFLWIGTFALFNTDIYYLFYLLITLILIFNILPENAFNTFKFKSIKFNKKNLFTILKAFPLILLLFFIFPRFYGFLPSVNNQSVGQIGYSTSINNSTFSGLSTNGKTAFYVELDQKININQLYWRGRVLTQTDGYNWKSTNGTYDKYPYQTKYQPNSNITYQIKNEQAFEGDIILLDTPIKIINTNLGYFKENQFQTFKTYQKKKKATLVAQSNIKAIITQKNVSIKKYIQLPTFIPQNVKKIFNKIDSSEINDFIFNFKKHLKKEGYTYSLTPGVMRVMNDFIQNKKGYCTHFASLLGILLRMKKVPTRLVSGFQGGRYNDLGKYYEISSNDAHAWVEYFSNNRWHRVDPTEFVSPNRIIQGGDIFLTQSAVDLNQNFIMRNYALMKKYINNINYKLSLFMDSFDREAQKDLASKFKLKLKHFYVIGSLVFVILMFLFLKLKRKHKKKISEIDKYFQRFIQKCEKKGYKVSLHETPSSIIKNLDESFPNEFILFLKEYELRKYGPNKDLGPLKDLISKI